ncbi:MAG: hypothetical protein JXB46_08390, partial [Candidatus Eisenbacteria bacterium]|nr:hypothetical protein [Candidatus Eisenbacteria bacterium]
WDHVGTWDVDRYGYARVRDGYLYCDDCGHQEEQFLVVVRASGYYSEDFEIELSYYHPSETLTFYLMPYYGREGDSGASAPDSAVRIDHHNGRVVVGVPVEEGGEIPTVDDGERTPATGERGTD